MSLVCFDPFFVTVEQSFIVSQIVNRPFSILGSKAWGNKTKEMYYLSISLKMISFVLFPKPHSLHKYEF